MTRTSTKSKKMNLSCDCNPGSICGTRDAVISVAYEVNSLNYNFVGIDFKLIAKVKFLLKATLKAFANITFMKELTSYPTMKAASFWHLTNLTL